METLLLDGDQVETNAKLADVIPAVEAAFAAYTRGDAQMPPKSYIDLPQYNGDFRAMPAYLDVGDWDAAGIKWVNVHLDNRREYGLPTVLGTFIYSDPANAFPLAIMDGTELTRQRTGAAAAVATDYLAIDDARTLGIIGAGVQSYTQLEGIAEVRPIEHVVVSDIDTTSVNAFIDHFGDQFMVESGSIADAAKCDILSTVTPVRQPIVELDMVGDHTHVNAIGADAAGKQELSDAILLNSKLVIDDYEQCIHSGEINVPWADGTLTADDIYAELGSIIIGNRPGRTSGDTITVFDSTGLAIQDIAAAHIVYEHAIESEDGTTVDLLGLD